MEGSADFIDQIIRRINERGEIQFALSNGGSETLKPPFANVANLGISGLSRGGEFTIVLIASIATITIPGKPPDGFDKPLPQ
jgi:hypothetical protein